MNLLLIVSLFFLSACSLFQSEKIDYLPSNYQDVTAQDYEQHLNHLGSEYRKNSDDKVIKLGKKGSAYLEQIYNKLVLNNEILLNRRLKPSFYIIKNYLPIYFTLPNGEIYFSSGLLLKYIKNENLLMSYLAVETIKIHKFLYKREVNVPTGVVSTAKIMAYSRLPFELKVEANKWAYLLLKRTGADAQAFLNWIQLQNKNSINFMFQYGDTGQLIREEFEFKNFLASQRIAGNIEEEFERNSSKGFYDLIRGSKENVMTLEKSEKVLLEDLISESFKKAELKYSIKDIFKLTGDASTRRYYRINCGEKNFCSLS